MDFLLLPDPLLSSLSLQDFIIPGASAMPTWEAVRNLQGFLGGSWRLQGPHLLGFSLPGTQGHLSRSPLLQLHSTLPIEPPRLRDPPGQLLIS